MRNLDTVLQKVKEGGCSSLSSMDIEVLFNTLKLPEFKEGLIESQLDRINLLFDKFDFSGYLSIPDIHNLLVIVKLSLIPSNTEVLSK